MRSIVPIYIAWNLICFWLSAFPIQSDLTVDDFWLIQYEKGLMGPIQEKKIREFAYDMNEWQKEINAVYGKCSKVKQKRKKYFNFIEKLESHNIKDKNMSPKNKKIFFGQINQF